MHKYERIQLNKKYIVETQYLKSDIFGYMIIDKDTKKEPIILVFNRFNQIQNF